MDKAVQEECWVVYSIIYYLDLHLSGKNRHRTETSDEHFITGVAHFTLFVVLLVSFVLVLVSSSSSSSSSLAAALVATIIKLFALLGCLAPLVGSCSSTFVLPKAEKPVAS